MGEPACGAPGRLRQGAGEGEGAQGARREGPEPAAPRDLPFAAGPDRAAQEGVRPGDSVVPAGRPHRRLSEIPSRPRARGRWTDGRGAEAVSGRRELELQFSRLCADEKGCVEERDGGELNVVRNED